ncbi:MAG: prepilin-type N-terminal cleavage/methylation domain-containing protein [Verrucomicrobiaceae bacterium]|nr:MAG: prepilin-type N-terminal cleavage/methylation domain-containing protein [Verrucomicrobiaceae bacterium]
MKTPTSKLSVQSAFSLVELLVVIAVIAVIAAIAIPNIANITQSADAATKLRNAQSLAMTYNNYAEAYYAVSNAYPTTADVPAAITAMAAGATVVNNRLNVTNSFRLPGITTDNVATNKLSLSNNQLVFTPGAN